MCEPVPCTKSEHEAISQFAKEIVIVIQLCNDNEYYASLKLMKAPKILKPDGQSQFERAVRFPNQHDMTIVLGMFAGHKAAIAKTKQGADCERDVQKVLSWFPNTKALLGVGVAFGLKRNTVKFCDVLVAEQIAVLNALPSAEEGGIASHGDLVPTKTTLKNVFCRNNKGWNFPCTKSGRLAKVFPGQLISSPLPIHSPAIIQKIQKHFKFAKGGDMEGWVLYTNIMDENPKLEVIIIKGVANYADGKKDNQWQLTAAMAAANYTHFQLEHSTAFHGMSTVNLLVCVLGYCSGHSDVNYSHKFRSWVWLVNHV